MAYGVPAAISPTPSNQSFGTLKRKVIRYVLLPDDAEPLALAGDEINDGIDALNARIWWWMLTFQDINVVVGQQDYTVNNDFKATHFMELLDTNDLPKGELDFYDPVRFKRRFPWADITGDPCAYTLENSTDTLLLSLDKKPSSNFQTNAPKMRHRYYRRLQRMTADNDTVIVPAEVESYLVWNARHILAMQFGDSRQINEAKVRAAATLQQLRRDDNEHHFHNWS